MRQRNIRATVNRLGTHSGEQAVVWHSASLHRLRPRVSRIHCGKRQVNSTAVTQRVPDWRLGEADAEKVLSSRVKGNS